MSEELAKAAIEPWLAPVPGDAPAGADARYEPLHEQIRAEAGKLDSPTTGQPEWDQLLSDAQKLTAETSKDLLIVSYAAGAMYELRGIQGLAEGLFLVAEVMDRYWDTMFPPTRRVRARVAAIDWLIGRIELTLADTPLTGDEHAAVAALEAAGNRLRAVVNEKFENQAPALRPLLDGIQRLKISLPAPDPAAAAPAPAAATPAAATPAAAPGPAAPSPADPPPAEPTSAPAAAPAAADSGGGVDYEAELLALAQPLIEPIPGDSPTGVDSRYEMAYEELVNDIKSLDTPTGAALDWSEVKRRATDILTGMTKDVLIATYLCWSQWETARLDGLSTGLSILAEMIDRYWDDMFPPKRRIRGRAASLTWLLDRLEEPLPAVTLTAEDKVAVDRLEVAVKRFTAVVRDKFEDAAPSMRPLQDSVQRLKMSLPAPAPPKPAPKPAAPAAAPTPAPTPTPAAPSGGSAVAMPDAKVEGLANPADIRKFTTKILGTVLEAASMLRKEVPADPGSYRLVGTAILMDTVQAPPAQQGSKTGVPAPPPNQLREFEAFLNKEDFTSLLDAAEGTLRTKRFWLDLHRFTCLALGGLGKDYELAKAEVLGRCAYFVRRYPELLELAFNDGTPFASDATKQWIEQEVLPSGGGGGGGGEPTDPRLSEASGLLAGGKKEDGLQLLMAVSRGGDGGRVRFKASLAMASALAGGKTLAAAEGIYGGLADEIDARGLEEWEPELAAECYRGWHKCLTQMKKPNDTSLVERTAEVYRRLARVDALAAMNAG